MSSVSLFVHADGYGRTDVSYIWTDGAGKSISTAQDMRLSQFDLVGIPSGNYTMKTPGGDPCAFSALYQVNTKYLHNIYKMFDQRRRRWADVVKLLIGYKCFVFAG